jgi:hypothetical protein
MRPRSIMIMLLCAGALAALAPPLPAQARGLMPAPPRVIHATRLRGVDPRDWRFGDDRDFYCFLGEES